MEGGYFFFFFLVFSFVGDFFLRHSIPSLSSSSVFSSFLPDHSSTSNLFATTTSRSSRASRPETGRGGTL